MARLAVMLMLLVGCVHIEERKDCDQKRIDIGGVFIVTSCLAPEEQETEEVSDAQ